MTGVADARRGPWSVIIASALAAVVGAFSSVVGDVARYDDGTFLADPSDLAAIDVGKAGLYRISAFTDMLGSYLLFVPAVVWLWHRFRAVNPIAVDIATVCGVVYAAVGAVGAAILVSARTPLIDAYAAASTAEQPAIASSYALMTDAVSGIWQVATASVGGVWFFTVGAVSRREWRAFGWFAMAFGVLALAAAVGRGLGADFESSAPATPIFLPIAVFIAWVAWRCWQDRPLAEQRRG